MNPSVTSLPIARGADKRREDRHPGKGKVVVRWVNPQRLEVEGRLVDVSASGFRMAHDCSSLTAGQFVEFSHVEAKGQARVVWTRIVSGTVESGFVVASDSAP
jgi:hypothetical protein